MVEQIVSEAREQLRKHDHFRYRSDSIGIDFQEGRLVLIGRLPSFYLKQVLQTALRGLPGVKRIDNRVDVVSPNGLSSVKGALNGRQTA
jgi:hypothetical protein